MPSRPSLPCTRQPCPALVPGGGRCPKHQTSTHRNRGSSTKQGYGHAWRDGPRAQVLREETCCAICGAPGTPSDHVDHIVSRKQGGTDARANLRRLCWSCHSRVTVQYDGGWGHSVKAGKA